MIRVQKASAVWRRARQRQRGNRKTSIGGGQSVYQEYLEGQRGDKECGKKPMGMWWCGQ